MTRPFALPAMLALVLVAGASISTAFAEPVTVMRCNVYSDGAWRPALITKIDGERHIVKVGEAGLTRAMAFSERPALDYARRAMQVQGRMIYADCTNVPESEDEVLQTAGLSFSTVDEDPVELPDEGLYDGVDE